MRSLNLHSWWHKYYCTKVDGKYTDICNFGVHIDIVFIRKWKGARSLSGSAKKKNSDEQTRAPGETVPGR